MKSENQYSHSTLPTLYLNSDILTKIWYLCSRINNVEWSGIIFCKTEGHPINPETFKATAIDILPMHKGEPTYTEFEPDERLIDAYENNPELENCKMGIIHSHVNMAVFFSATDSQTLKEYAKISNYCISVIVNNAGNIIAKVAYPFLVKSKTKDFYFKNSEGQWETYETQENLKEEIVIKELDFKIEKQIDTVFVENVEKIIKSHEESKTSKLYSSNLFDYTYESEDSYDYLQSYKTRKITDKDRIHNFICKCLLLDENLGSLDIKYCLKKAENVLINEETNLYSKFIYDNIETYYKSATNKTYVNNLEIKEFLEECLLVLENYLFDYKVSEILYEAFEEYLSKLSYFNKYKK